MTKSIWIFILEFRLSYYNIGNYCRSFAYLLFLVIW